MCTPCSETNRVCSYEEPLVLQKSSQRQQKELLEKIEFLEGKLAKLELSQLELRPAPKPCRELSEITLSIKRDRC